MKLFKARLKTRYLNSHTQQGGYPDVYVIAESQEGAETKLWEQQPVDDHLRMSGIIFCAEVKETVIV